MMTSADLEEKIPKWLGITNQQFEILRTLHYLEIKGSKTNPKNILDEYTVMFNKELQRQNLFVQIKPLIAENIITKVEKGIYAMNIPALKKIVMDKENEMLRELDDFKTFSKTLKNSLEKIALKPHKPITKYIEAEHFFSILTKSMRRASIYYADSPFPNLAYSYQFASAIGRTDFVEVQWERCFRNNELKINYLTNLNVEFPFFRALKVFGDIEKAYKEVDTAINQLESHVEQFENLDIRYTNPLPGPHGYIIEYEGGGPAEVFLAARGSNVYRPVHDPYGGVYIASPDVAKRVCADFINVFKTSTKLKDKTGKKVIERTRLCLESVYKKASSSFLG